MGSRQYHNTPTSGFRDHGAGYAAMPPPYSKYSNPAVTASERQPLLTISVVPAVRRPQGSARKPMTWSVVVGIAILHFIAIFYAVWVLAYYWRSSHGPLSPAPLPTYNIAIIGAGPAGIAAAQHLYNSLFAREVNFNITIYESKPVVGGVLAIHHANGSSVFPKDDPMQSPITAEDITGKALLWDNTLFTRDSEKALRDKVDFFERGPEQIGYYRNGAKTVSATRPYSKTPLWTWLHLLWSYGNSVGLGNDLAQDGTLREAMTKVPLVPDIERIFQSLGVLNAAKQPARHMLGGRGISERYAAEIVEPQVQRAYHQSLSTVSGLTAMMAAAREESANAYEGGDVIDRLQKIVSETNVNVRTSTRVTGMKYLEMDEERPAWLIRYESAEGNGGDDSNFSFEIFDKVILAAVDFSIQLENDDPPISDLATHYNIDADAAEAAVAGEDPTVPVHLTFFTSEKKLSPWDENDGQVLFLEAWEAAGLRELDLVREIVDYHGFEAKVEYLYRALSDRSALKELNTYGDITWSYETTIEKAYPISFPLQRFPRFDLPFPSGLWWTSVIQRAGTSIDLNWLAGKIVAQELIKEVSKK